MMKTVPQASHTNSNAPVESMLDGMEHQAPISRPSGYTGPDGNSTTESSTSPHVIDNRNELSSNTLDAALSQGSSRLGQSTDGSRSKGIGTSHNSDAANIIRPSNQPNNNSSSMDHNLTLGDIPRNHTEDAQWNEFMQTGTTFDQSMAIAGGEGLDPFSGFDIPFWLGQDQYWGMINDWQ